MVQAYRPLEADAFEVPLRKRFSMLATKRVFIAAAILFVALIALFSSRGLTTDIHLSSTSSLPLAQLSPAILTTKAAVIIENRPLDNLIPIILHFSSVLGPTWPIHIFTDESHTSQFSTSIPFSREVNARRFRIRTLPADTVLTTHAAISSFFTKPWFWEAMAPAEHLLLFQADSMLCSRSSHQVDDFLQYDFVGAPVDSSRGLGWGYNGGLSLRNRSMCLDITRRYDWSQERLGDHEKANVDYEDQWFSLKMKELPEGANLPSTEEAMKFSVETMWADKPLGYHQPFVWQKERMEEVLAWCPELRMCTTETFTDHNTENFGG